MGQEDGKPQAADRPRRSLPIPGRPLTLGRKSRLTITPRKVGPPRPRGGSGWTPTAARARPCPGGTHGLRAAGRGRAPRAPVRDGGSGRWGEAGPGPLPAAPTRVGLARNLGGRGGRGPFNCLARDAETGGRSRACARRGRVRAVRARGVRGDAAVGFPEAADRGRRAHRWLEASEGGRRRRRRRARARKGAAAAGPDRTSPRTCRSARGAAGARPLRERRPRLRRGGRAQPAVRAPR